jgi:molybdenum cofactor biosynthesis enzyme MoaA
MTFTTIAPEVKQQLGITPYVTFPLINVCTQKCVYCGDGAEMTLCDVRQFDTNDLLEWHSAAVALGVKKFRITGGETLLHTDFTTIVDTVARDANIVLINTNGTLMKKYRSKWEHSSSNCLYVVNYHGASEEVYDRVSASTGYYAVAREGIEMLAAAGLLYRLNAVMNKYNIHEVWEIIAYCKELGTNLKIQDVVSVPWSFNQWSDVYVDTSALEDEFARRATRIREHRYARSFGTPTKIYTIDGVNVTMKSVRNGSQYDLDGVCKACTYFPCHEGVYDLFVFADNTAWACNWTDMARAPKGSKKDQLEYMIDLFRRAAYRPAAHGLHEIKIQDEMPQGTKLIQITV